MDDSSFMIYVGLGEDVLRQKREGRKERKRRIAQSRFPLRESLRLGDLELLRPLLPTGDLPGPGGPKGLTGCVSGCAILLAGTSLGNGSGTGNGHLLLLLLAWG